MIVVQFKNFMIGNPEQSSRLTAGGFFIFCNLPLLVEFGIIIDNGNGVTEMKLKYTDLRVGMLVNVSHMRCDITNLKYRRARIHALLSPDAIICEVNPEEGGCIGSEQSKRAACMVAGYPIDPDKFYHSCDISMRSFYSATLDKSAISVMLVKMQGE